MIKRRQAKALVKELVDMSNTGYGDNVLADFLLKRVREYETENFNKKFERDEAGT